MAIGNLLTMEGMRALNELALSGKPLPPAWKMDVEKYTVHKKRAVDIKRQMYLDCLEDLEEAMRIKEILYAYDRKI